MKRRHFLKAAGATVAALTLRGIVLEGSQDSLGAVRTSLFDESTGDTTGWVIANSNADGQLIVEVHLDGGEPNSVFDVEVWINGEYDDENAGELTTNIKGKGNEHLTLPITAYSQGGATEIEVQVLLLSV